MTQLLQANKWKRFGDGTKRLKCTRCKKVLDRVNVDESEEVKCLDCYNNS